MKNIKDIEISMRGVFINSKKEIQFFFVIALMAFEYALDVSRPKS